MLYLIVWVLIAWQRTIAQVPPWISADYRSEIRTKGGREVIIRCPVCNDNESSVMIQWYKGNKLIHTNEWPRFHLVTNGSKLKIAGARAEDSGKYFCTADNGYGKTNVSIKLVIDMDEVRPDSCPVKLLRQLNASQVVEYLAKLELRKEEVNISSRTVLSCWVRSQIRPSVCWLKETTAQQMLPPSIPLLSLGHRKFQVMPSNETVERENDALTTRAMFQKEMTIDPVDEGHAGNYYCLSLDGAGFKIAAIKLVVFESAEGQNCEYVSVPIWVLLLPTFVFLVLAGGLVCWLKTRDADNPTTDNQETSFTILGMKRARNDSKSEVTFKMS